jgi:hypothetical protein
MKSEIPIEIEKYSRYTNIIFIDRISNKRRRAKIRINRT